LIYGLLIWKKSYVPWWWYPKLVGIIVGTLSWKIKTVSKEKHWREGISTNPSLVWVTWSYHQVRITITLHLSTNDSPRKTRYPKFSFTKSA
jgi:hypothetical protein